MTRDDFRIAPKYYATSTLTMIFFKDKIIESVEIFKNYSAFEDAGEKAIRLAEIKKQVDANEKRVALGKKAKPLKVAPPNMKLKKDKRTEQEISGECERLIVKFIKENSLHYAVHD